MARESFRRFQLAPFQIDKRLVGQLAPDLHFVGAMSASEGLDPDRDLPNCHLFARP